MKKIVIEVGQDFEVPELLLEEGDPQFRQAALIIGASAVKHLLEIRGDTTKTLEHELAILTRQHSQEIERLREESRRHLAKVRENVESDVVHHKVREALLGEREKHAAERESLTARLEERHANLIARAEGAAAETRKHLEQLRAEHEGLVVKLMARLEPSATVARGGSGATTSAFSLGRTFEENVERHLRQAFGARQGFYLEDVHATGHCGDLLMVFDGLRILIELKSYDPRTRVPTKEVEKLARDLAEVQPRCDAAIMISACSEIAGHYSCGPLEVSSTVACVPVLFINNFLSLGEPQLTLHMTRVFLSMVSSLAVTTRSLETSEPEDEDRFRRATAECSRRCTGYLSELTRQSADLLRQVTAMKNGAVKLRETVIALMECEVARFNGIIQLMTAEEQAPPSLDRTVFSDPATMSPSIKELAASLSAAFQLGNQCPTREILQFIQENTKMKSEKAAREAMKSLFLESVVKHGHVVGISKKQPEDPAE